mmetsp:Transcript_80158/g.223204  ORF Transcript_80158/g.223204 Transcript_80158/m.223204 type:complete len:288 (+) Transcript_80158:1886-2749(+)
MTKLGIPPSAGVKRNVKGHSVELGDWLAPPRLRPLQNATIVRVHETPCSGAPTLALSRRLRGEFASSRVDAIVPRAARVTESARVGRVATGDGNLDGGLIPRPCHALASWVTLAIRTSCTRDRGRGTSRSTVRTRPRSRSFKSARVKVLRRLVLGKGHRGRNICCDRVDLFRSLHLVHPSGHRVGPQCKVDWTCWRLQRLTEPRVVCGRGGGKQCVQIRLDLAMHLLRGNPELLAVRRHAGLHDNLLGIVGQAEVIDSGQFVRFGESKRHIGPGRIYEGCCKREGFV